MKHSQTKDMLTLHTTLYRETRHPYAFSFVVSVVIIGYALFYTPSLEVLHHSIQATENIQFVNIDEIEVQKRTVKKDVSMETADSTENMNNVERATGTSDEADAVNLAFHTNIAPPKLISRLKKNHPKIAKEMEVEASVTVALLIAANGMVQKINIIGIKLSKDLPQELYAKMTTLFYRYALQSLKHARYSPTIIDGKNVPVKVDEVIHFRLQ
jgi:predicted aconitase